MVACASARRSCAPPGPGVSGCASRSGCARDHLSPGRERAAHGVLPLLQGWRAAVRREGLRVGAESDGSRDRVEAPEAPLPRGDARRVAQEGALESQDRGGRMKLICSVDNVLLNPAHVVWVNGDMVNPRAVCKVRMSTGEQFDVVASELGQVWRDNQLEGPLRDRK